MTVLDLTPRPRVAARGRSRVAVVGGGANCEHEVSLASAAAVAAALAGLPGSPYDVVRLTIDRRGEWRDDEQRPLGLAGAVQVLRSCDVTVPVVHGPRGEDGTLAALCDLADVRYVGSGVTAGAVAMDKWTTKLVARALGVATAPGVLLTRDVPTRDVPTWDDVTPDGAHPGPWHGPVVVKPVAAGSSLGVTLVRRPDELPAALAAAFALDRRVLVEDLVVGREVCVAVLQRPDGSRVVPPVEEVRCHGIFDHAAKYGGAADVRIPADLQTDERLLLERAALTVFDALGCRGLARVDFFLTADGPVLNEVNTMPGLTPHSAVPLMFAAGGTSYGELLDTLVGDCLGVRPDVLR